MTVTKKPIQTNEALIKEHGRHDKDSGSVSVQVAILTQQISHLTEHLKTHKKDHHSRYGLIKMVNKRRKLLRYTSCVDHEAYQKLIQKLELRR